MNEIRRPWGFYSEGKTEVKKMNKEEALKKIEELKKFVEDCDKEVKKNIITKHPTKQHDEGHINGVWAFSIIPEVIVGEDKQGNLFLTTCNGEWYDESGNRVHGYLFFKTK